MRLINLYTYELEEHDDDHVPEYAILSHRWEDQEVLFANWKDVNEWSLAEPGSRPKGWRKVLSFCDAARKFGLKHGWVDTVAIDKSSSAELTQAINSMYRYYKNSSVCLIYLSDVLGVCSSFSEPGGLFSVVKRLGTVRNHPEVLDAIRDLTKIPVSVLRGKREPRDFPVATRMSWAAERQTTRLEDQAYCLLGLFDINLPLIYGEGARAFGRLQEEIIRRSTDHTIFAWRAVSCTYWPVQLSVLFAAAPNAFANSTRDGLAECYRDVEGWIESYEVTNHGLEISLPLVKCQSFQDVYHAVLNCRHRNGLGPVALNVQRGGQPYNVRDHKDSARVLLRPVAVEDANKGPCTATHNGRTAVIYEEDLITAIKTHVTILRGSGSHFIARGALTGVQADAQPRRSMFGFSSDESSSMPVRKERLPHDIWVGDSSITRDLSPRTGISFEIPGSGCIGIIMYWYSLSFLGVRLAVVKLGGQEGLTLEEAVASAQVLDSHQKLGAGCSVLFSLERPARVLTVRLEVTHSMETQYFILAATLGRPQSQETVELDVPSLGHVSRIVEPQVVTSDSTGTLRHLPELGTTPQALWSLTEASHRHAPVSREDGHALIKTIAQSVFAPTI
ncbi:hypothetical protein LTR56_007700 [Elasticomyces elasticus]|nr:hypothetical protein LTR56_007700 [Elasticomyces elasticus]KAK3661928.1 hypothetical protein LTR22_007302 [Elasticomyces elasticus]KAK4925559.1 hypothetical protein LTR49_007397 [Elasticomyces elasticus]KAK5759837.1 hypothetical protein LTS12_010024 [Elasticomyces elasticus]